MSRLKRRNAALELGLGRRAGQARDDIAEGGARPVATTTRVAVPLTTEVPSRTTLGASASERRRRGAVGCLLLGRQRLAGQRRLLHVQVARLEQARIGRDEIAGAEPDDIARHQLTSRQLAPRRRRAARVAVGAT